MKRFLQAIIIVLTLLVIVCIVGFSAFLIKWYQCTETKSVPELAGTQFQAENIGLGEKIPCTFTVKTSWSLMPVSANITATEGVQEGKESSVEPGKWMWGTRLWNVTVWVQPYRDGTYPEIPVRILCEGGPDGKAVVDAKIPGFTVSLKESDLSGNLDIEESADSAQEEAPNRRWIWYLCGAIVLILCFLVWLFIYIKRRKKAEKEQPWVMALNDISELRLQLQEQSITAENAVTKLTYIIRNYLEECFQLRAERQTTSEFQESLRRDVSPMNVEQRMFLREFMTSADMVKFARISTDGKMFEDAAERAESLIRTTSPTTDGKEKKS